MRNLSRVLKTTNARLSIGNTWLYYDNLAREWVVLERRYGRHKNNVLYRGEKLTLALEALKNDEVKE